MSATLTTAVRSTSRGSRRHAFRGLDIIRAVAAVMVLGDHTFRATLAPATTPAGAVASHLGGGVDIFFVLSGFLLYRPFLVPAGRALPAREQFWRNRVLRIVPAYWAALTVYAILGLIATVSIVARLINYSFLQTWLPHGPNLIPPSWTLCCEAAFYFLLPFYGAWAYRRWGPASRAKVELRWMLWAFLALTVLRVLITDVGKRIRPVVGRLDLTIVGTLDMFLLGMALAVIVADPALRAKARDRCPRVRVAWPAAIAIYVAVAIATTPYDFTQWSVIDRAWMMTVALLLIAPVVLRKGSVPKGGAARALTEIGVASYGLYIWHYPLVLWLRRQHLGGAGFMLAAATASLAVGFASYYLVERPFLRRHRSQQPSNSTRTSAS